MNCKIIYISHGALTKSLAEALFIEHLIKEGAEIEWWDIAALVNINHNNIHIENFTHLIHKIKDWAELSKMIKDNASNAIFDVQTNFEFRFLRMFFYLKKFKCTTFLIASVFLPQSTFKTNLLRKNLYYKIKKTIIYLLFKSNILKSYDAIFTVGGYGHKLFKSVNQLVSISAPGYEECIMYAQDHKLLQNHIIFLDQYLPFHPDFKLQKTQHELKYPANYFSDLNIFFDSIERHLNQKVIIAAHPKADYSKHNPFNGRKIITNQTKELTANASLVLSHASASIAYAILFNKPLLLIYNDDIANNLPSIYNLILSMSEYLNIEPINLNHSFNFSTPRKANLAKYQEYIYDFLLNIDSEKNSNKEIISKNLKALCLKINKIHLTS